MTRGRTLLAVAVALVFAVVVVVLVRQGDESVGEDGGSARTVFVGDSVTRGISSETRTPDEDYSWVPYALADGRTPWRLDANVAVLGRTLVEMEQHFHDDVLARDPEGVVILGGTNDVLRQLPVEDSLAALEQMVRSAQEEGARVWVVSPPPLDPGYGKPVQPMVDAQAELAAELDVPYVDLSGLAGPDGRWQEGLSEDGVHPTVDGAQALADLVLDEVGQ